MFDIDEQSSEHPNKPTEILHTSRALHVTRGQTQRQLIWISSELVKLAGQRSFAQKIQVEEDQKASKANTEATNKWYTIKYQHQTPTPNTNTNKTKIQPSPSQNYTNAKQQQQQRTKAPTYQGTKATTTKAKEESSVETNVTKPNIYT